MGKSEEISIDHETVSEGMSTWVIADQFSSGNILYRICKDSYGAIRVFVDDIENGFAIIDFKAMPDRNEVIDNYDYLLYARKKVADD